MHQNKIKKMRTHTKQKIILHSFEMRQQEKKRQKNTELKNNMKNIL